MTSFALIYDGYASLNGTPDHLVPKLDPTDLCGASHGLSGTEIHLFGTARELTKQGHSVVVLGSWVHRGGFSKNGVAFLDLTMLEELRTDVAIAYHDARPLGRVRANVRKFSHHQSYGLSPQEDATNFAEAYFSATERCAAYHRERRGWDCRVVPNGWDYGAHQPWQPVPGRLIWNTGFERGFHRLMEVFPEILARVPEAHVVGFVRGGPVAIERAYHSITALGPDNIGKIQILPTSSRNEVLKAVATAACFAYPCDPPSPTEVWPMSVTDCMATGVPVVLAPDDGIEELFSGACPLPPSIKRHPTTWKEPFVNCVVDVLTNRGNAASATSYTGHFWAVQHTFARSVDALLGHLRDLGALA